MELDGNLTKEIEINNRIYSIEKFKGEKGFLIKAKLAKLLAPALRDFVKNESEIEIDENGEVKEKDNSKFAIAIASGIETLLSNLDADKLLGLMKELISNTFDGNGKRISFDNEFSANYGTLYLLIKEIIVFNYGDVFQMLGLQELLVNRA